MLSKAKVKNKAPAEIQITAEQLLREAKERELEILPPPPKQKISDPDELDAYKGRKRKEYEDAIRKNRSVLVVWLKYAEFEDSQQELIRARSIFERCLEVHHRVPSVWLRYVEMELRNRQTQHARNIMDRAVATLPRCNQFWYKYAYFEELLGNIAGARHVFERWMAWEPEQQAWQTYINFELRYRELQRARAIFAKFVGVHPEVKNWIKFAKFEQRNGRAELAREVYEHAIEFFGDEMLDEKLFAQFARFEEEQHEFERAKVIYRYALDRLPRERSEQLFQQYALFEKRHGDRQGIESVVLRKRVQKYELQLEANPLDYDCWFDYVRMLETEASVDQVRIVYERAVSNIPPKKEKRFWRRYIYLWIYYAVFEELEAQDMHRAREVYCFCLKLIPHKQFTFAKFWLMAAKFEIRQRQLDAARKLLGTALGMCPKEKLFREYITLELVLRDFTRCRKLYERFIEFQPENCRTWIDFASFESLLGEVERARSLYEMAIEQPRLDMPELLWKSFIDFEIEQREIDRARNLFERLLERTQHYKVWITFAQFELEHFDDKPDEQQDELESQGASEAAISQARSVFERAHKSLSNSDDKESRKELLKDWLKFEEENNKDPAARDERVKHVQSQMPKLVKRRRKVTLDDGSEGGWEEVYDYVFPSDESNKNITSLLEKARQWKLAKAKQQQQHEQQQHEQCDESENATSFITSQAESNDKENLHANGLASEHIEASSETVYNANEINLDDI